MWQLIKAEFAYVHRTLILVVLFLLPFFLLYMRVSTVTVQYVLHPLAVASVISLLMFRSMERRERQQALLPLSLQQIALARVLLILIPSAFFYGGYYLLHLLLWRFSPVWACEGYDMVMFLGLILLGFLLYLVLHDFFASNVSSYKSGESDVVILLAVIAVILLGIPLLLTVWQRPSADLLRVLCLVAGGAMIYPAIASFVKRRSYLG